MPHTDSVDKIVLTYMACVTAEPFTYKDQTIEPRTLHVSPGILRGFTCPAHCGGCCPKFSLDYLPEESHPYPLTARQVLFNSREITIWSDLQLENKSNRCNNLQWDNGRCGIHGKQPFSCDFELIRFMVRDDKNHVTQRLFGRGWNMKRTDGGRGAYCTITEADEVSRADCVRKLNRLKQWTDHFQLQTKLPEVIKWAENVPLNTSIPFYV